MPAAFTETSPRRARETTKIVLSLVLPLALVIAACGDDGSRDAEPPPRSVDPLAAQPDRPLVSSESIEVTERFRLGPAARTASGMRRPLDLAYDAEGNLYVLDGSEPTRILKFDPEGTFLFRFGRHDEEDRARLSRATSLAVSPWNTVLTVDRDLNYFVTFLTLGTFTGAAEIHGVGIDALALPEFGQFYLQKWDPDRRVAYVVRMSAPLDSLGTPYSIGLQVGGRSVRQEARDVAFETAVDREGRLYVAFSDAYPVRVLTPEGETVRVVGIDRPPPGKTAAEIDAERQRNYAEVEARFPDVSDSLKAEAAEPEPEHLVVEEMAVDPSGRLWVRTHREDAGEGTVYDVFNAEGEFLAVVRVPGAVRRTAFAPDGTLVTIDGSSEASREIVGYAVDLHAASPPEAGAGESGSTPEAPPDGA